MEAFRAFLNPRSGGYNWQKAHADVGHLAVTLGRVMEVRDRPPGKTSPRGEAALLRASKEEARLRLQVQGRTLGPRTHSQVPPQCVTLDKLEAAASEAALVERALKLLSEHRFWAGIVFLGPEDSPDPAQSPGHGHVRIKIRMDIDDVARTDKIKDRWGSLWGGSRAGVLGTMPPIRDLGRWGPNP